MISLRPMQLADIDAGLKLCRAAGWNQHAGEWELFLRCSPGGCLVSLSDDGQITGSVTTIRYGEHVAWISMLLVFPEYRNKGVGQQLLRAACEALQDVETVKLDATPAGREVYLRNAFHDEYGITRFVSRQRKWQPGKKSCKPIATAADLPGVREFDAKVFGADRAALLQWLVDAAPELAHHKREGDEIVAFCLGRRGFLYNHIGPVVASSAEDAAELVTAAVEQCDDRPVIIDVPRPEPEWLRWLAAYGFTPLRDFTRMFTGPNPTPGQRTLQFAVAGPEFG